MSTKEKTKAQLVEELSESQRLHRQAEKRLAAAKEALAKIRSAVGTIDDAKAHAAAALKALPNIRERKA